MIYLHKEEFEKRALDIAIADVNRSRQAMYPGALDASMREARRQLVNAGFAWEYMDDWDVDECEHCLACESARARDFHSGVEFSCGSLLVFNGYGTIEFVDKCSKEDAK